MKTIKIVAAFTFAFVVGQWCVAGVAWPQPYPAKPVRVIVPFPPGGANDIVARVVLPKVSEQMGQQFVIENRTGAGGTIGTALVAQSKPDGYTLMVQSIASHVSNPHLYKKLPYDALGDFVAVAPMTRLVAVLSVHPSLPVYSVKDFLALARSRPKQIMFGHAGVGSFVHLNAVLLESLAGIRVTQVPFKGGGPAIIGLMSGETQAMIIGVGDIFEYLKSNRARPLGVTSAERIALIPNVPTIAETGLPAYEATAWFTIGAAAKVPADIVRKLNGDIDAWLKSADMQGKWREMGVTPLGGTPDVASKFFASEIVKWNGVIKAANIRAD